jgi:hypothetical protein
VALGSCQTAQDQPTVVTPPVTFSPHLDRALEIATASNNDDRVEIYTRVARSLARAGRVEAATDVLLAAESIPLSLGEASEADDRIVMLRTRMVTVWHAVAARDETRAAAVDRRTVAVLGLIRDRTLAGAPNTALLVDLLEALLANPNAGDEVFRRTIDQLYLINGDAIRAERLVEAGERVEDAEQNVSLNPIVQQAIAAVPALDDPLLAADLNARLAVLSVVLGRPRDETMLLDRVMARASQGIAVGTDGMARLERTVTLLVEAGRVDDALALASNVSPVSARARALARVAIASGNPDGVEDALALVRSISDGQTRLTAGAAIVRARAFADPGWNASAEGGALLSNVRVDALPAEVRERVLASFTAAYLIAGQTDAETRLRGLIGSQDEYARVSIGAAELLLAEGTEARAAEAVGRITRMPATAVGTAPLPAARAAAVWYALGEYDRVVLVAESLDDVAFARTIASLPADFVPAAATVGVLNRRATTRQ